MTRQQGRVLVDIAAIVYGVRVVTWRGGFSHYPLPDVDLDELVGILDFDDLGKPPRSASCGVE